jgi:hypothetical protein
MVPVCVPGPGTAGVAGVTVACPVSGPVTLTLVTETRSGRLTTTLKYKVPVTVPFTVTETAWGAGACEFASALKLRVAGDI